jgi:TatD DNase family protein
LKPDLLRPLNFLDKFMLAAYGNMIDIGANLQHASFVHDCEAVIAAAKAAGIINIIVTGTNVEASTLAATLAAAHPEFLYSTAGVHPHDANTFGPTTPAQLAALALQPQVVAIGETGLDFYRNFSPPQVQETAFAEQLALAVQTQLPAFLHQRDAHSRFMAILKEQRTRLAKGVVHCFTGTRGELYDYLDQDMYIGITGWVCDERRGIPVQELLRDIPPNRLLLETDAPYLMPRNITPKPSNRRNVPANLSWVVAMVANCLHLSPQEVASLSTSNAKDFFNI